MEQPNKAQLWGLWKASRSVRIAEIAACMNDSWEEEYDVLHELQTSYDWECETGATQAREILLRFDVESPRTANVILMLLAEPLFLMPRADKNGIEEFWEALVELALATRDPRIPEALRNLRDRILGWTRGWDEIAEQNMYVCFPLGPYLRHLLNTDVEFESVELTTEQILICEEFENEYSAELAQRRQTLVANEESRSRQQELLDEIRTDPDSEELRWQLVECVAERLPKFAELMMLQIAEGEPVSYEEDLVNDHFHRWIPRIAHLISEPVFDRGVLVDCVIDQPHRQPVIESDFCDPGWRDLESLTIADGNWRLYVDEEFVLNEPLVTLVTQHMPALKNIHGVRSTVLPKLADRKPTWEYIGVRVEGEPTKGSVDALAQFQSVQTLGLESYSGRHVLEWVEALGKFSADLAIRITRIDEDEFDWRHLFLMARGKKLPKVNVVWRTFAPDYCELVMTISDGEEVFVEQRPTGDSRISSSVILKILDKLEDYGISKFCWQTPKPPTVRGFTAVKNRVDRLQIRDVELPQHEQVLAQEESVFEQAKSFTQDSEPKEIVAAGDLRRSDLRRVFERLVLGGSDVQREPFFALLPVANEHSVPALLRAWREMKLAEALESLALLDATEVVPELLAEIPESNDHHKGLLITSLGYFGGVESATAAMTVLRERFKSKPDSPDPLRRSCLQTLLELEDETCVPFLVERFENLGFYDATIAGCLLSVRKADVVLPNLLEFANRPGKQFLPGRLKLPAAALLGESNTDETIRELADALESWETKEVRVSLIHPLIALGTHAENPRFAVFKLAIGETISRWNMEIEYAQMDEYSPRRELWKRTVQRLSDAWSI